MFGFPVGEDAGIADPAARASAADARTACISASSHIGVFDGDIGDTAASASACTKTTAADACAAVAIVGVVAVGNNGAVSDLDGIGIAGAPAADTGSFAALGVDDGILAGDGDVGTPAAAGAVRLFIQTVGIIAITAADACTSRAAVGRDIAAGNGNVRAVAAAGDAAASTADAGSAKAAVGNDRAARNSDVRTICIISTADASAAKAAVSSERTGNIIVVLDGHRSVIVGLFNACVAHSAANGVFAVQFNAAVAAYGNSSTICCRGGGAPVDFEILKGDVGILDGDGVLVRFSGDGDVAILVFFIVVFGAVLVRIGDLVLIDFDVAVVDVVVLGKGWHSRRCHNAGNGHSGNAAFDGFL